MGNRVVHMTDWEAAGSFLQCASPGNLVDGEVVTALCRANGTATYDDDYIQVKSNLMVKTRAETGGWQIVPVYLTFYRMRAETWKYPGLCLKGESFPAEVKP